MYFCVTEQTAFDVKNTLKGERRWEGNERGDKTNKQSEKGRSIFIKGLRGVLRVLRKSWKLQSLMQHK